MPSPYIRCNHCQQIYPFSTESANVRRLFRVTNVAILDESPLVQGKKLYYCDRGCYEEASRREQEDDDSSSSVDSIVD